VQDEGRDDAVPIGGAAELVRRFHGGLQVGRRLLGRSCLEGETAGHEGAIGEVRGCAQVGKRRPVVAFDQRSTAVDERLLVGRSH
jgi:hypothetical protein